MNISLMEIGILVALILAGMKVLERVFESLMAKYRLKNGGHSSNPGNHADVRELNRLIGSVNSKLGNIDNTLDDVREALAEIKGMLRGGP